MEPVARPRLVELDALRLVAVAMVLVNHLYMVAVPESWPTVVRALFAAGVRGGWAGVDLFFVLSGFLVSGLLFAEYQARGALALDRFYVRRAWKIYPAFYAMLALSLAACAAAGVPTPTPNVLVEVLFLQSYLPGFWIHTWSLAVEEHFYLLLPLVLLGLARRSPGAVDPFARGLPAIVAAVAVLSLAARVLGAARHPTFDHAVHFLPTHLRLDGLFFGVLLSYAYHFRRAAFTRIVASRRWPLIAAGCLALLPPFVFGQHEHLWLTTYGLTANYLGAGAVLAGLLHVRLPASRAVRAVSFLGQCSYSIYLWHIPWVLLGVPLVERGLGAELGFGPRVALTLGGALGLGVLFTKLVEAPALRLRERWFPSRRRAHPPAGIL